MTGIILALTLLSTPVRADYKQCNGPLTSNGVCIGSELNVPPSTIDCARDSSDSRCRREQR